MSITIASSAFASLEAERRLLNAVFKGPTGKDGRVGFRGGRRKSAWTR